jgi:hypothetical protein
MFPFGFHLQMLREHDAVVRRLVTFATRTPSSSYAMHIRSGSVKSLGDTRFVNLNSTDGSLYRPGPHQIHMVDSSAQTLKLCSGSRER